MEILLIYPVFCGMSIAIAELAKQRGYSARWWFLISLILPIISIFIVLMLKKKEHSLKPIPKWAKQQLPNDKVLYSSITTHKG
jgi:hypothetical protein